MENTEELKIDIEDIGTILKSSRLKSKKSMEEISGELCIRKIYLTALEEGDFKTLPPIPYGVGYVRTYARYLGLNPERAVKLYKDTAKVEEQKAETEDIIPEANKSNIRHIILCVLILALIYGGWELYVQKDNTVKMVAEVTSQSEAETLISEMETISESMSQLSGNDLTTVLPENEMSGNIGTPMPIEAETDVKIQQEEILTRPTEKEQLETTESAILMNNKVIVEFTGESWIELKARDRVYFQGIFRAGDKKEIDYIDNLFLSVGRPENVKVFVKGTEKNLLNRRRKTNIPIDALE